MFQLANDFSTCNLVDGYGHDIRSPLFDLSRGPVSYCDTRVVVRECSSIWHVALLLEGTKQSHGCGIPNPHRSVLGAGHEKVIIWRKFDRSDVLCVTFKSEHFIVPRLVNFGWTNQPSRHAISERRLDKALLWSEDERRSVELQGCKVTGEMISVGQKTVHRTSIVCLRRNERCCVETLLLYLLWRCFGVVLWYEELRKHFPAMPSPQTKK